MSSIRSGNRHRRRNQERETLRAVFNHRIDRIVKDAVKRTIAGETVMLHGTPGMDLHKRVAAGIARQGNRLVPVQRAS